MKRPSATTVATGLVALACLDLALVVVTGGRSLLGDEVGVAGFVARLTAIGALVIWRFRLLPAPERRMEGGRLLLLLLFLPTLGQFQFSGGRLSGVDSISYYVFLRSMVKDRDFDLVNEYTHYEMITRRDLATTTKTGLRRSIYSVGPAVVWTPFFLAGDGVARAEAALTGVPADLSGYGSRHVNAVALGSLLYGFAALLTIHALLLRYFSSATALAVVLLVWLATFFHWYLVVQPTYAHNASTLAAAYALWLWDRDRGREGSVFGHFFLGVVLGLAMCIRWQNGVLLLLPGLELALRFARDPASLPRLLARGAVLGAGVILGAFPQMAAWKALYDMWVLPYPPQGTDFLRFGHPWVLETLFSSRHGLLSWTPVLWLGYLGFVPLHRRRPELARLLVLPLVLMTYVNLCVGDYWGGASFSNRRFDSVLPILAFGFAAGIDALRDALAAHPQAVLALVGAPFVAWNLALVGAVDRGLVPRDDTVGFPQLVRAGAQAFSDVAGFPTTWPASWIFAWREDLPPSQYDRLVGSYLFYRQNSRGGRIDLGSTEDDVLLGEGWTRREVYDGVSVRGVRGRARVLAPLDVPEDLDVGLRAVAPDGATEARLLVNGHEAGRLPLEARFTTPRVRVPRALWRREINDVALDVGGARVLVDTVDLARPSRR